MTLSSTQSIPEEYICPITQELMQDPLMSRTGKNFERSAILKWIAEHNNTCPLTRQTLTVSDLIQNRVLKSDIQRWCRRNGMVNDNNNENSNSACGKMGKNLDDYDDMPEVLLTCLSADLPKDPKITLGGSIKRKYRRRLMGINLPGGRN